MDELYIICLIYMVAIKYMYHEYKKYALKFK